MQSVLQYRRFGKAVEAEYLADQEKAVPSAAERAAEANEAAKKEDLAATDSATLSSETQGREPVEEKVKEEEEEKGVEKLDSFDDGSISLGLERVESSPMDQNVHELPEDLRPSISRSKSAGVARYVTHVKRTDTSELERQGTQLGLTITGVDVRRRTTREGRGEPGQSCKVFVVGYEGPDDKLNPHNWGIGIRIVAVGIIASIGFMVGLASSIDSGALVNAAEDFGVSQVSESLATGLYLVGFACGALFAGPVSETLGRNIVYISTLIFFMIFVMASGLAPNIGAQLAFRWLAGFFGSTPLVCGGGSLSDLFNPLERVYTYPLYANAAFLGPILGPVMGGWISQAATAGRISWRWTEWTTLCGSGVVLALVIFILPETYPPLLLSWRAKHLRRVTGDQRYRALAEIRQMSFLARLKVALVRPFVMLFTEPIVILISFYLSLVWIILFTFFDGYNYVFAEPYGTSPGITGTCFVGMAVGLFGCFLLVPTIYKWAKAEMALPERNGKLRPEFRLWWAMLGASASIPVSLFWMGWTDYSSISIWSPILSSVLFGYGVLGVFIATTQYLIDTYEMYSASALAGITLIRYFAAGGMTVVGIPFYEVMGVHWTLTILGGISALLVPLPYAFYFYGQPIRARSKHAIVRD